MLSSLVVSRQIQSKSHSNRLTEFRPDTKAYLSNIRMIDIGASVTPSATEYYYPTNVGTDVLIKSVTIFSGNTQISDCQVSKYAGYKNGQMDNAHQFSMLPALKKTRQGTINVLERGVNLTAGYMKVRQNLRSESAVKNRVQIASGHLGYTRLSDFNEFLSATSTLNFIPNLKIVVEWNAPTSSNLDCPDGVAVTGYTINRPMLIMDEIVDEATLSQLSPKMDVAYLNVEYARQDIEAVASGTQRSTLRPQTFNGKYLKDLVIAVRPITDDNLTSSGLANSVARTLFEEKWQLYLNGATVLPQDGSDSAARKMLYNIISRGALARTMMHNTYSTLYENDYVSWDRLQNQEGRQGYLALGVEGQVNQLDVVLRRTFSTITDLNSSADVDFFGRVARRFTLDGDKVMTTY